MTYALKVTFDCYNGSSETYIPLVQNLTLCETNDYKVELAEFMLKGNSWMGIRDLKISPCILFETEEEKLEFENKGSLFNINETFEGSLIVEPRLVHWYKTKKCYITNLYVFDDLCYEARNYLNPMDTEPNITICLTQELADCFYEDSFSCCDSCNRSIANDNGYNYHFIHDEEECELKCTACYMEECLTHGMYEELKDKIDGNSLNSFDTISRDLARLSFYKYKRDEELTRALRNWSSLEPEDKEHWKPIIDSNYIVFVYEYDYFSKDYGIFYTAPKDRELPEIGQFVYGVNQRTDRDFDMEIPCRLDNGIIKSVSFSNNLTEIVLRSVPYEGADHEITSIVNAVFPTQVEAINYAKEINNFKRGQVEQWVQRLVDKNANYDEWLIRIAKEK